MTKIRLIIYTSILVLILSALIICIFCLTKKNKPIDEINIEITPPPIIEISWSEAVNLVQNCQIKSVFQKRKLEVTLTDKENRVFKTIEPKFNDIFIETNNLRSDCNDIIQTVTE